MTRLLPLLPLHSPEDLVAWHNGPVSARRFLHDVEQLVARLPERPVVLNLSENRYHFLLGFAAALVAGHVSLLPPNRTPHAVRQLKERYPEVYCLADSEDRSEGIPTVQVGGQTRNASARTNFFIPEDRVAAIAFTSGTTGEPQPHVKHWSSLVHVARATGERFSLAASERVTVIATVPPQHMFGLETSIMLPIQNGGVVHGARPFFPADVRTAIETRPGSILVTTPVHIRACVEAGVRFPPLRFVLSATAPLSQALAAQAEQSFSAPVLEIYGCTEAGTIGTRRTVTQKAWQLLDGLSLRFEGESAILEAPHLDEAVTLNDYVTLQPDGHLVLRGRKADLVNIAGKRTSLVDLNQGLLEIDGVLDGVFLVPSESDGPVMRLVALVVAPGRTEDQVMTALRSRLDPVFLPRPLYLVERLPRNPTGKLSRDELLRLVARCEGSMVRIRA